MNTTPSRAFELVLKLSADTKHDLVSALINFAHAIERDEITKGVSGGYSSGAIYELVSDPSQTHERYFQLLSEYLDKRDKFINPIDNAKNNPENPNNA